MTSFYVRLDEADKTPAQIDQREETYRAAKVLRDNGFNVRVMEHFTGKSTEADAASIVLKMAGER